MNRSGLRLVLLMGLAHLQVQAGGLVMATNARGQVLYVQPMSTNTLLGAPPKGISPERYHAWDPLIIEAGNTYAVGPLLIKAIVEQESGFNAKAISPAGAQGGAQFMRSTANDIGIADRTNPREFIWGCAALLRRLCDAFDGSMVLMAAAYNAGEGRVLEANVPCPHCGGATQVRRVQGNSVLTCRREGAGVWKATFTEGEAMVRNRLRSGIAGVVPQIPETLAYVPKVLWRWERNRVIQLRKPH